MPFDRPGSGSAAQLDGRLSYVVAIHVPVFVDGDRLYFATDWVRALVLLRQSFGDAVGSFTVVAPQLPMAAGSEQRLSEFRQNDHGITVVPSFDFSVRARHYWLRERARWLSDVRAHVRHADIAHVGLCNLYRPVNLDAFRAAAASDATIVFVRDTDEIRKKQQLIAYEGRTETIRERLYRHIYSRAMTYCVRRADLSLLKGDLLFARYQSIAKNPQTFEDTSYLSSEIVDWSCVLARIGSLSEDRPLKFVYCGRMEKRKGLHESIRLIGHARSLGANIDFDIIGDGEQRGELEALVGDMGLNGHVRLLGPREYGPDLLGDLAGYDGLLFTPIAEDTPRMIFDGYSAGLPLIAHDIAYVQERKRKDEAVIELPLGDPDAGAQILADLDKQRDRLGEAAERAHQAAHYHEAEAWYRRRAEWTLDAVARKRPMSVAATLNR